MNHLATLSLCILILSYSTGIGCSRLPGRIAMTKIDPVAAAKSALAEYDGDGSGSISTAEAGVSGALSAAFGTIDADANGEITAAEVEQRIGYWLEKDQALLVLPCEVTYRGKPLYDATIKFIPEPFLGEAFKPASGVTDDFGVANIMHAIEDRPDPDFPQGVRVGLYRVEISRIVDGEELLPAKFNVESTLGQEVAPGATGLGQGLLKFDLR